MVLTNVARMFSIHIRCFDNLVGCEKSSSSIRAVLESGHMGRFVSGSYWVEFCGVCGAEMDNGDSVYFGFHVRDDNSDL